MHWRSAARRGSKWACTAAAAACVVVFGVSMFWWVGWRGPLGNWAVWSTSGAVVGGWDIGFGGPTYGPSGFQAEARWIEPRRVLWRPLTERASNYRGVVIPLWIPFLLTAAPAAWLWRADRRAARRARAGACTACGYDRAGLAAEVKCPECGTVPST